jgi:hypothetical protein
MRQYIYAFLLIFSFTAAFGQTAQVRFGKNRVQYHKDFAEWSQYESDNFITYWYGEARYVGQAVVQIAEYDFEEIQSILEHRINEKIEIIVYADVTDLKQGNIGVEETFTNTGGQTKIVGNKVFVYFDGNHDNLRRQVREGIASVYLDAMLFGSNLQEIVQNALMMNLPEWFKEGFIAYVGQDWNTELDNQLRDIIQSEEYESFEKFADDNPKLAGHSLWHFLSVNFGNATISNLLYLTRINRSIESSFLYVLGNSYDAVLKNWGTYYESRYQEDIRTKEDAVGQEVVIKNKRNLPITQLKLSPDGSRVAFVMNEIGKYKVFVHNFATGKTKKIFKDGFRNPFQATDYNYPILAWSPNNVELAVLYERRDQPKLMLYNTTTKKEVTEDFGPQFQRVYDIDFIDPQNLVISGAQSGYSDIFIYFMRNRSFQRITTDFYDDMDVAFVEIEDRKGILFSSNRQDSLIRPMRMDTILPLNSFDLFYYDLEARSNELIRITNTPFADERQPVAINNKYFGYLSDENGIYNNQVAYLEEYIHHFNQRIFMDDGTEIVLHADSSLSKLDSTLIDSIIVEPVIKERAIIHANSNYSSNVVMHHTAPKVDRKVEMFLNYGEHKVIQRPINQEKVTLPLPTAFRKSRLNYFPYQIPRQDTIERLAEKADSLRTIIRQDSIEDIQPEQILEPRDTTQYFFQVRFQEDDDVPETATDNVGEVATTAQPADKEAEEIFGFFQNINTEVIPRYEERDVYRFRPARITPYRLKFRTDYVTTQMDNSLLFEGLESFAANPQEIFSFPPPGILLKANFKDLFEDYEFEGGVRIPTTFNGTEYFVVFNNKKRRLDHTIAVYRRNQRLSERSRSIIPNVPNKRDVNILLGQYSIRYPFDIFTSVRATATLRRDRVTQLASDLPTYDIPTQSEQRVGLRLEYIFDNTLDVSLNIKNGTRYKFYAEAYKKFDLEVINGLSLDFDEGAMMILGVDFRHYQRILKHSVWATRGAAATSFGSEKMLFFLGGVENWLFSTENDKIPYPTSGDFAFRALAANMRGFDLNIRNGNSFALINTELRVPMFRYVFKRLRSSLLQNFQVIGFFDVGTAWQGSSPFDEDNPLNTDTIETNDFVSIRVNFFRDPIVMGYGIGARTMLFGYFLRLDYAWGIETKVVQDPKLYISIGTDF